MTTINPINVMTAALRIIDVGPCKFSMVTPPTQLESMAVNKSKQGESHLPAYSPPRAEYWLTVRNSKRAVPLDLRTTPPKCRGAARTKFQSLLRIRNP